MEGEGDKGQGQQQEVPAGKICDLPGLVVRKQTSNDCMLQLFSTFLYSHCRSILSVIST